MSGFESDDSTENDGTEYNSYYGFSSKDRQQAQFVREDNAKRDKRSKAAAEREEELHFPRGEVPKLSQLIVEQFDGEKAVTTQDTLVSLSLTSKWGDIPYAAGSPSIIIISSNFTSITHNHHTNNNPFISFLISGSLFSHVRLIRDANSAGHGRISLLVR